MKRLLYSTGAKNGTPSFQQLVFIVLLVIVKHCSSHGLHLSNTISFTALDLAKNAGMGEEDISAAAMLGGGEDVDEEEGVEGARQIPQDEVDIPPISDDITGSVLPLCCSRETDDLVYYRCGGSSVSKENLNDNNNGIQRSWTAPSIAVSTKESIGFR